MSNARSPPAPPSSGRERDRPARPVFVALADDVRREVLGGLGQGGTVTDSGLARELPLSRQAIARHRAVLDAAGLVTKRREGGETLYALR